MVPHVKTTTTMNIASFWSWDNVNWVSQVLLVILAGIALVSGTIVNRRQSREIAATNERAAKLEKDAAEARLELAKLDPLNLPIKSVTAEVFLMVRGDFHDWPFPNEMLKTSVHVSLCSKEIALVMLRCVACESFPIMTSPAEPNATQANLDGRFFSMSFAWPSSDWIDAQDFKYWIDLNNASTSMLDTEMVAAVISIPPLKSESAEVLQSSCVVTINGSIRRKFAVPKSFPKTGSIVCPPIKD